MKPRKAKRLSYRPSMWILSVLLLAVCTQLIVLPGMVRVYADEDARIMQTTWDEERVKLYVRNTSPSDDIGIQFGMDASESVRSYAVSDDENPMRTLIMVDNSLSIPSGSRQKVIETIQSILLGHGQGEKIRLATMSDQVTYLTDSFSDDYLALSNTAASIQYFDQETYLTDVLCDVISELNQEPYLGYTRIIIISDGVDNKQFGLTRDELYEALSKTPYPIMTIGCYTGKNDEDLANMFAISRKTGAEYCILEQTDVQAIASMTAEENQMTVFEAQIPEAAKTGGRQNIQLVLADGTELQTEAAVPFGQRAQEPEKEAEPEVEAAPEPVADTEPVKEPEQAEQSSNENNAFRFLIPVALVAIIAAVAAWMIAKTKKDKKTGNENTTGSDAQIRDFVSTDDEKTVLDSSMFESSDHDKTVLITPDGHDDSYHHYIITLTAVNDPTRTFRGELTDSPQDKLRIGRKSDNDIIIADDPNVSRYHCSISCRNHSFFIEDNKDTSNPTVFNERITLRQGLEQLIVSGCTLKIGKRTYTFTVLE